jgi:hypothetical protein
VADAKAIAEKPTIDPTDRSIPAVRITNVMPMPGKPTMAVWREPLTVVELEEVVGQQRPDHDHVEAGEEDPRLTDPPPGRAASHRQVQTAHTVGEHRRRYWRGFGPGRGAGRGAELSRHVWPNGRSSHRRSAGSCR